MKKSIFLFFAAILCAIGMNAETYRYSGENDGWAGTEMTASTDGFYSYYGPVTGAHKFKIGTSSDQWAYNYSYVSKGFNNTDITDIGDWGSDNCYTWTSATHYILVYYPNTTINTTNKVKICASTVLPNDAGSEPDPEPEPEPTELTYNVTVPAGTKACYIAGGMNTWSFTEMTKVDDTHYTITIEGAKKSDEYKYASGADWGYVEKDASGNEIGNRTYDDGNDVVARWASVYDPDAVEQELTYSVTVPEGTYACYIAMDTDPAQDGWEFNEMTKVDETHYTFVRTGLKNKTYKYTSGPGWEYVEITAEDGNVADRQWAENDVVAKWTSVYNPTAPTYDYYIAGTLAGGWSAKQQGLEKDGELYKATFNALAAGTYEFKITDGQWNNEGDATHEHTTLGATYEGVSYNEGNIKIVTEEAKDITVIFDATADEITFEGLTEIEDYYTVVGVAELFGEAWATASETNKMVKQVDGSYKLVKENVTLAAIGYDWKIAKNGDWWGDAAIGVNPSEGNNTLTITTAGRYNVTFTLAADFTTATVETELLEAAVVIPDCFISGNATLTGGEGWQGNEFTMVYDEETETWSYTLADLQPEKAYELKVVCGGTWYSYADLASVPTGVTEGNDHSIAFKMAEAGDVTVTYNVAAGITISGNFYVAPTYDYYIAGNMNGWDKAHVDYGMTDENADGIYEKEITLAAGQDHQFKVTNGKWGSETDGFDCATVEGAYEEVDSKDGNVLVKLNAETTFTVKFDKNAKKISFEGLTKVEPETLVYTVEVPEGTEDCYIAGEMNGWEFEQMTQVNATQWTITYDNVLKTTEYKYAWQASWDYKELDQEGNDVANRTWTANDVVEKWNKPYTEVRTGLTVGQWGTLCPKQNVENPTGATFYQIAYLEEKCGMPFNMHFDQITETTLTAGQPYFFIASETEIKGVKWGEPKTEGSKVNGFYGYIGETSWTLPYQASFDATSDENTFVIWNNSVFRINAETSIKSERCYININSSEPSRTSEPAPVGARRITMGVSGVNGQNTATGVDQVQGDNVPTKMIINGQLFILRGEKMYDAQGKLVK